MKRGVRGGEVVGKELELTKEQRAGNGVGCVCVERKRGVEVGDGVGVFVLRVKGAGKKDVGFLFQRGGGGVVGKERIGGIFGKRGFVRVELELREPVKDG